MAAEIPPLREGHLELSGHLTLSEAAQYIKELSAKLDAVKKELTSISFTHLHGLFPGHILQMLRQLKSCDKLEEINLANTNLGKDELAKLKELLVGDKKILQDEQKIRLIFGERERKLCSYALRSLVSVNVEVYVGQTKLTALTTEEKKEREEVIEAKKTGASMLASEKLTIANWILVTSVLAIISWGVLTGLSFIPNFGLVEILKMASLPLGKALSLYVNFDAFMGFVGTAAHLFYPAMAVTSVVIIPSLIIGLGYFFYQYGCKSNGPDDSICSGISFGSTYAHHAIKPHGKSNGHQVSRVASSRDIRRGKYGQRIWPTTDAASKYAGQNDIDLALHARREDESESGEEVQDEFKMDKQAEETPFSR